MQMRSSRTEREAEDSAVSLAGDSRVHLVLSTRPARLALTSLVVLLATASPAIAADGVGLWGRTDDKVITFWGFGLMAFFTILVVGLSIMQNRSESRKDREREELERLRRD